MGKRGRAEVVLAGRARARGPPGLLGLTGPPGPRRMAAWRSVGGNRGSHRAMRLSHPRVMVVLSRSVDGNRGPHPNMLLSHPSMVQNHQRFIPTEPET